MKKFKDKIASNVLSTMLLTVFIDLLGVGILIPVIPQLLGNPHSAFYLLPHGWSYKDGLILLGFLNAIYPFMHLFSTISIRHLSQNWGS